MSRYRESGIAEWFRFSATLLVRAEAHHAAGDADAAKRAIREARDDLLTGAELIEDPAYRRCFLAGAGRRVAERGLKRGR